MSKTIEELTLENELLTKQLQDITNEHQLVVITIAKTLKSIGLWPIAANDNIASKAIKGVKTVITDSMLNPNGLAERFAFIKDLIPIAEKYKDVIINY